MKKIMVCLVSILMFFSCVASCEEQEAWRQAPIITQAYEISPGKLYLAWDGHAPVYQVYMDGENAASVIVNNAVIPLKEGTHSIMIYPISESKNADTKIEVGLDASVIGASLGLDLAALGLDPKNLTAGNPSATLHVDYNESTLFAAVPEALRAVTDEHDQVLLSFTDRYHADEYVVSVKIGKDINYVKFSRGDEAAQKLIQQNKTLVTLTLAPEFLEAQECMIPELENKYTFTVQLRKYAENLVDHSSIETAVHQSKESSGLSYTPTAAWKTAPMITYASQTADGQIELQWEHERYGKDCDYAVMRIHKKIGIKTGETEIGRTKECHFSINDLMNGDYVLAIVPMLEEEKGFSSDDVNVTVHNDWVIAPVLRCEENDGGTVRLSWTTTEGVERYVLTVYQGDSTSLLRFVDLDYSKYGEYQLDATEGEMEYLFEYEGDVNAETGVKLKFELYGIRHAANGEEQRTDSSTQILTIGQAEIHEKN